MGLYSSTLRRGFTLIEVLVVLFIISIAVGFIVPSIGDTTDRKLEEQAKRFMALVKLAREEAIFQSAELGLYVEPDNYRFFTFVDNRWQPLVHERQFRLRKLGDNQVLDLVLEGESQRLIQSDKSKLKKETLPQVIFFSSGEITPFEAIFLATHQDIQYRVRATLQGELSLYKGANFDKRLDELP